MQRSSKVRLPYPLHVRATVHSFVIARIGFGCRLSLHRHRLDASAERQYDQKGAEPSMQLHCSKIPYPARVIVLDAADARADRSPRHLLPQNGAASFDHLIGAGEDRRRDCQSELLGSLQIDGELVVRGSFDRQLCS
jgi:hypothetical protein